MPAATGAVRIDRSPAEVFTFLADGLNGPRWRSGVLDVSHESGDGVGARYRQGVKGPGGRRVAADYEITASEPGRRLAFQATAGPVRPSGEYVLEPAGAGTELRFSLHVELSFLKKLVMGSAVQRSMDAEVAALSRLKQVLEDSRPA